MRMLYVVPASLLIVAGALAVKSMPNRVVLAAYTTSLGGRTPNQRHNATLACLRLNGAWIEPNSEFSFNKRVGSFGREEGYRRAPVAYSGKLINDWGGGVCQVSTTAYNAFLHAGFQIRQRTHHQFAPLYVEPGRDSAVAYPSIDLVVGNPYDQRIKLESEIVGDRLIVRLVGSQAVEDRPEITSKKVLVEGPKEVFLRSDGPSRISTKGSPGYSVTTFSTRHGQTQVISHDEYPAMPRVRIGGD